ncbi:hypothetical protein BDZ97DRAFT_1959262 [Flammula alnicola]|nr:hypothetical protein BDZ97DRAFT_1959262 [Flammula alnicola]
MFEHTTSAGRPYSDFNMAQKITTFVRTFIITDHTHNNFHSAHNNTSDRTSEIHRLSLLHSDRWGGSRENYHQITDNNSILSQILGRLGALREVTVSFNHRQGLINWDDVSSSIQQLFRRKTVKVATLRGLKNLPAKLSKSLLSVEELYVAQCRFAAISTNIKYHPGPLELKKFFYEPSDTLIDGQPAQFVDVRHGGTILEHWLACDCALPGIEVFSLSIANWRCIREAAVCLDVFRTSIQVLSLSTVGLGLSNARPNLSTNEMSVANEMDNAALENLLRAIQPTEAGSLLTDGWFTRAFSPISLANSSIQQGRLTILDFGVSYWKLLMEDRYNGELHWLGDLFENMPDANASAIREIRINIDVEIKFGVGNASAVLLEDFANDEVWCILNEALSKKKWIGLQRVFITLDSRIMPQWYAQEIGNRLPELKRKVLDLGWRIFTES